MDVTFETDHLGVVFITIISSLVLTGIKRSGYRGWNVPKSCCFRNTKDHVTHTAG